MRPLCERPPTEPTTGAGDTGGYLYGNGGAGRRQRGGSVLAECVTVTNGIAVANMPGANAPPIAEGTLTAGDSRTSRRR